MISLDDIILPTTAERPTLESIILDLIRQHPHINKTELTLKLAASCAQYHLIIDDKIQQQLLTQLVDDGKLARIAILKHTDDTMSATYYHLPDVCITIAGNYRLSV